MDAVDNGLLGGLFVPIVNSNLLGSNDVITVSNGTAGGGALGGNTLTFTVTFPRHQAPRHNITGTVRSHNINWATRYELRRTDGPTDSGIELSYEPYVLVPGTATGQVTQKFTFSNVPAGRYTLVITKGGHLSFTIHDIHVRSTDAGGIIIDTDNAADVNLVQDPRLTAHLVATPHLGAGERSIHLIPGDLNGDGVVDSFDIGLLTTRLFPGYSSIIAHSGRYANLSGSGVVSIEDFNILIPFDGRRAIVIQ
jgi:hypothetical protein